MTNPTLGPEWKPEKAKLIVHMGNNFLQISVDPNFPHAWSKPPFYAQIKNWAAEGARRQQFVFVRIGPRVIAVLPDREVDLGRVVIDADFIVRRRSGPGEAIYDVEAVDPPPPNGAVEHPLNVGF